MTTVEQIRAICGGCFLCAVDTPASAATERLGLLPFTLIYRCPTCRRFVPWCYGAADDMPEDCDRCWDAAHATRDDAAPAARSNC